MKICDMGVGCEQVGICYAEAHGEPWRCSLYEGPNMITWTVTEQEADYIMKCLNGRPHGEVRGLIDKLVAQANPAQNPLVPQRPESVDQPVAG